LDNATAKLRTILPATQYNRDVELQLIATGPVYV